MSNNPRVEYETRRERCAAEQAGLERRSARQANISVALFALGIGALVAAVALGNVWLIAAAIVLGLSFVASLALHYRIDLRSRRARELVALANEGLARIDRDWEALPLRPAPANVPATHPYAADLDLRGPASLEHLLGTPATPAGQTALLDWLLAPAEPHTVAQRQAAVGELAEQVDRREAFALRGRLLDAKQTQAGWEAFVHWAEDGPWLARRKWLLWLARILATATTVALVAWLAGWLSWPLWVIGVTINLLIILTIGRGVDEQVERVAERQPVFEAYAAMFADLLGQNSRAAALRAIQTELSADGRRADDQMQRLGRIMAFVDFRRFLFFFFVNIFTLWNIHALGMLEHWQRDAGGRTRAWLRALGEWEALAALAALRFDNPEWVFPELRDEPVVRAERLGHPLLPAAAMVENDVSLGPPGTLLLVTGSNMSGKSTLLRAIGVNIVLAQAGGPVCAKRLQLPALQLATSMRIQDSLEAGVSHFMAELRRIKLVVDLAGEAENGSRTLLYLLDEILHGTNSDERRAAVRRIMRFLLQHRAIGAVTTHDVALVDEPAIAAAARLVHFREQFSRGPEGPVMRFDYRLRPGPATSRNALALMEILGLPGDG